MADSDRVRILFVCLGNICRSPTAEAVVRDIARAEFPDLELTLDSAGTGDYHIGAPPDARASAHAAKRGYDLEMLRARQVEPADFRRFDLILAMDEANRRDLETIRPADATAKLSLFLEFAPGRAGESVPDPYFGGEPGFEQVLDLSEAAARGLLAALRRGLVGGGRQSGSRRDGRSGGLGLRDG